MTRRQRLIAFYRLAKCVRVADPHGVELLVLQRDIVIAAAIKAPEEPFSKEGCELFSFSIASRGGNELLVEKKRREKKL